MTTTTIGRYRLDHEGYVFEVETGATGLSTVARLFVDGSQVDEQKSVEQSIRLEGGGLIVVVSLNWIGQVTQVLAVPSGTDPKRADVEGISFTAPPGSRAAKLESLKREHPELYAARHVVIALFQVLIGVLGISALLRGLLSRISLPGISLPELSVIPLPDVPDLPWPDIPWPVIVVPDPIQAILASIKEIWASVNWLVPIAIAILVSINEIRKRRMREKAATARQQQQAAEATSGR